MEIARTKSLRSARLAMEDSRMIQKGYFPSVSKKGKYYEVAFEPRQVVAERVINNARANAFKTVEKIILKSTETLDYHNCLRKGGAFPR